MAETSTGLGGYNMARILTRISVNTELLFAESTAMKQASDAVAGARDEIRQANRHGDFRTAGIHVVANAIRTNRTMLENMVGHLDSLSNVLRDAAIAFEAIQTQALASQGNRRR